MRAFLACPLPEEVISYLKTLIPLLPEASLIIPKQHDLTLKFLGNVPEEILPEVQKRLSTLHFEPFKASLSGLGVFSERRIRTVWVGIEPQKIFQDLHTQVDELLTPLFATDDRFLPHITLARVKALKDRKAFLKKLLGIPVEAISFSVDRLLFIKSELTSTGANHTPLFEIHC